MKLQVAGFVPESITDGPGIRFTVFCQGCPHHCPGCQNPQTWPAEGGRSWDVEAVYRKIRDNPLVRGVTFSGGEPFCQCAALARLGAMLKADGYELACYTGYAWEELWEMRQHRPETDGLLRQLDVLIDGRFVLAERSLELRFRGSRNQRILDVPKSLAEGKAVPVSAERWVG